MLNRVAEDSFERGILALEANEWREATAFFEAALTLERRLMPRTPQARYRSFYGLCLGLAKKRHHDAVNICRSAIEMEKYNPDLHWNLGRVLYDAGRKKEAFRVFVRGVKQQPRHKGLRKDLRRMGMRKRPVLPFLKRDHPINVALGRMRAETDAKNRLRRRLRRKAS
jgi:tetratricopeptide (TPR) repeat protein